MSNGNIEIARKFVAAATGRDWRKTGTTPEEIATVFLETLLAAGFEVAAVVPGKLNGHYCEQDGSRTGETFPINATCPSKAQAADGTDHYPATGWLDRLLLLALARRGTDEERVEAVRAEIERAVPLEPIRLTADGDLLREYPPGHRGFGQRYFVDHTRDESKLNTCVGTHAYCGGWMDRRGATATHDAIVCRGCHLRVLFPKTVDTYGELRQALAIPS